MNIYLTIMVTALVLTQIIRVTQNHISLRRQEMALRRDLAWIKRAEPTEQDFENQREAFRLLREKLEQERAPLTVLEWDDVEKKEGDG